METRAFFPILLVLCATTRFVLCQNGTELRANTTGLNLVNSSSSPLRNVTANVYNPPSNTSTTVSAIPPEIAPKINLTSLLEAKLDAIIKNGVACFHPKWVNTVVDFKNHRWGASLGDTPAIVYPFCSDSSGLGNWLG